MSWAKERFVTLAKGSAQIRWLWLSLIVFLLDQGSKWLAEHYLAPYQPIAVFPGFNWLLAYNRGAAFSLFASADGWQHYFFSALAVLVSVALIIWMRRMTPREKLSGAGASLIIGGAIGNLFDRMLWGHVIDFIDWYVGTYHWPTFNIADSAITVGCVLLIIDAWRAERKNA